MRKIRVHFRSQSCYVGSARLANGRVFRERGGVPAMQVVGFLAPPISNRKERDL